MPPPDAAIAVRPSRPAFRVPRSAFLVAAAVLLIVSVIVTTVQNLDSPWTSIRLAPTFALLQGDPLYSLPTQPPWVMVGYGPLYPWLYLPCVLARGPLVAVTTGTLLAHLYILGPVALLCRAFAARLAAAKGPRARPPAPATVLPGLLFFGVLMCLVGSVESVARHVHVDAPTYGLLLLACYAALRAERPGSAHSSLGWTVAAGVCAGMSVCCKANALGSLGALGLYVWWALGWRRLAAYALGAAAVVALVYGWAAWQSGAAAIAHNFRTLGRFPWHKFQAIEFNNWSYGECSRDPREKLFAAGYLTLQAIQTYAIPFGVTALFAYSLGRRAPDAPARIAPPLPGPGRMIGCLLWVTLLGAPAAVLSTAKYGGEVNSWAFIGVPLAAAAALLVMALLDRATPTERLAAHGLLGGMVLVVLLGSALVFQRLDPRGGTSMGEAYRTLKTHPGQCYFASDPLDHLLAGDRFRPNLDTVYSYWVGGSPIDPAVFKTAMPASLEYVVVSRKMEGWGGDEVHRLLPEESVPTDRLGLKYHDVWTKP